MCVKGVASVEARLSSFRHVDPFSWSHAVLRHAAVGIHLYISLLHVLGWAPFEGLCARLFWLKAGTQFKRQS